jgi:hypothetical protein
VRRFGAARREDSAPRFFLDALEQSTVDGGVALLLLALTDVAKDEQAETISLNRDRSCAHS